MDPISWTGLRVSQARAQVLLAMMSEPPDSYRVSRRHHCGFDADRDLNAAKNIFTRAFGPDRQGNSAWVAQGHGLLPELQRVQPVVTFVCNPL